MEQIEQEAHDDLHPTPYTLHPKPYTLNPNEDMCATHMLYDIADVLY